jgi:DNA-binding PadR family transcriptional regulator
MKYTVEKVLYFANEASRLHVAPNEFTRKTTLANLTQELEKQGKIFVTGEDDSGKYYRTTLAGQIELLELQIAWRRSHGKDTGEHEAELERLTTPSSRRLRA